MRVSKPLIVALASVAVAACAGTASTTAEGPSATSPVPPLFARHTMQAEVNPAIVGIWDVTNNAMDETGSLDPALISEEQWDGLAASAAELAAAGDRMATARLIRAASPGNWETGEYEVSMDQVQALIDANPDGFRREAAEFAAMSRELQRAATARDVETAGTLALNMDQECAVCHAAYWYGE